MERTKHKLESLGASSKKWWKLTHDLMMRSSPTSAIPPLRKEDGSWLIDATDKANLFAGKFAAKSALQNACDNAFTEISDTGCDQQSGFLPIRRRAALKVLRSLRKDSSTGPDNMASRILKRCCVSLALPITLLARCILEHGCWPCSWRTHWVLPLFKKRAKSDPGNYRGIHLTPQISKVMERLLGTLFLPYLEATGAYGPNQFAYRKKRSFMDALALAYFTG